MTKSSILASISNSYLLGPISVAEGAKNVFEETISNNQDRSHKMVLSVIIEMRSYLDSKENKGFVPRLVRC